MCLGGTRDTGTGDVGTARGRRREWSGERGAPVLAPPPPPPPGCSRGRRWTCDGDARRRREGAARGGAGRGECEGVLAVGWGAGLHPPQGTVLPPGAGGCPMPGWGGWGGVMFAAGDTSRGSSARCGRRAASGQRTDRAREHTGIARPRHQHGPGMHGHSTSMARPRHQYDGMAAAPPQHHHSTGAAHHGAATATPRPWHRHPPGTVRPCRSPKARVKGGVRRAGLGEAGAAGGGENPRTLRPPSAGV